MRRFQADVGFVQIPVILEDRVIVQYEAVRESDLLGYYTFQIVLFDNGNIRMYYKDISSNDSWALGLLAAFIEDPEKKDGLLASDYEHPIAWQDAMAIGFYYPGPAIISAAQNGSGIVMPGQSTNVVLTFNTADLVQGLTSKNVNIISNDPFRPATIANVKLNVTSGGIASPVVSESAIDFGDVFQGATKTATFYIKNEGSAPITLNSVSVQGGKFLLTGKTSGTIKARHSEQYMVTLPTASLGAVSDQVIINYATGSPATVALTGNVVPAPAITVDLSPVNEVLDHRSKKDLPFTIENSGQSNLEVAVTGSEWATTDMAVAPVSGSSVRDFEYNYSSSGDAGGPQFDWVDARVKGTKVEGLDPSEGGKFWEKITLPWSFSFYGEDYTELFIGFNGIISFTANQENSYWPQNIPSPETPNNFIAPWWGAAGYDSYNNPETAGIFYRADETKVVISFERMINLFSGMGDPMSVQVILYKNGSIKFQYRQDGVLELTSNQGVVGIENKTGTEGVEIAAFQQLEMLNGLAYVLSPAFKRVLAPGEKIEGNVTLDATNLYAGVYATNIHIHSNAPNREALDKPVTLTVNGQATLGEIDPIAFGEVMAYEKTINGYTSQASYEKEFTLSNTGSAALNFQRFGIESENNELSFQLLLDGPWGPEWTAVENLWVMPVLKPEQTIKARLVFSPGGSYADLSNNVVIVSDLATKVIPVTGTIILPPVLKVDKTPVNVSFNLPFDTGTRSVGFDNIDGASGLQYEWSIDFKRTSTKSSGNEKLALTRTALLKVTDAPRVAGLDVKGQSFNRVLQFEESESANSFLGFNGESDFTVATRFNAGSKGFNLSHVQAYFRSENMDSGNIEVEIRAGGNNVADAPVLAKMNTSFNRDTPDEDGGWLTIKLGESVKVLPNEDFYVIVTYPLEINFPQGVVNNAEVVEGRYMFSSEGLWYDVQDYPEFHTFGWMVRAAEETYSASAWVSIDGQTSGALAKGATGTVQLKFDGAPAEQGDQKADLVIRSNDPYHSAVRVPIKLHMNEAPLFKGMPTLTKEVRENESLSISVKVMDPEANTFTVGTTSTYPRLAFNLSGSDLIVTYTPDYTDAGLHEFVFESRDEFKATRQVTFTVNVINVNRPPVFIGRENELNYFGKGSFDEERLSVFFGDPDNDPLTFTVASSDPKIANVFASADRFVVKPVAFGESKLAFVVKDVNGGEAKDTLTVKVNAILAVEDEFNTGVKLFPNPASNLTKVELDQNWTGRVTVEVIDAAGKQHIVQNAEGSNAQVDVSNLVRGLYILRVTGNEKRVFLKLVKE